VVSSISDCGRTIDGSADYNFTFERADEEQGNWPWLILGLTRSYAASNCEEQIRT